MRAAGNGKAGNKLKCSQQRSSGEFKNCSLKFVIEKLIKKKLLSSNAEMMIENHYIETDFKLTRVGTTNKIKYNYNMRTLSIILHYYSPKAYAHLQRFFRVPSEARIKRWCIKEEIGPGFLAVSLRKIKYYVTLRSQPQYCCVVLAEMQLRPNIPKASRALFFMAVALNDSWRIPIGYFLVSSLTDQVAKVLILIRYISEAGAICKAVVTRNPSQGIARVFGVTLENPYFIPPFLGEKIHFIYDACYVLKWLRILMSNNGTYKNKTGKRADWKFIRKLYDYQCSQVISAATKTTSPHTYFRRLKINDQHLQIFNESVANSLRLLLALREPDFMYCQGTIDFIDMINRLSDILNSRNFCANGHKSPIDSTNFYSIKHFFVQCAAYLKSLSLTNGTKMINHHKAFIKDLLITMNSVIGLAEELIIKEKSLKYLMTGKLCHDSVEIFFEILRSKIGAGYDLDPYAIQGTRALRTMLIGNFPMFDNGNCIDSSENFVCYDRDSIHDFDTDKAERTNQNLQYINLEETKANLITQNIPLLSMSTVNIFDYIGGFIVRKLILLERIECNTCIIFLLKKNCIFHDSLHFLNIINAVGQVEPSFAVIKICEITERAFRSLDIKNQILNDRIYEMVNNFVFDSILNCKYFDTLKNHLLDQEINTFTHYEITIKLIIKCYIDIKLYYKIRIAKFKKYILNDI
ncbi:unnamed protein product [Gordionus sp. m RMFG-2023]